MAIAGAGAGVNELTALAATSEMAPTRKRGVYVAVLIFTIVPFCPSVLWAQLITVHSNWRYVGAFCGAWNGFGLLITILFYKPPPRVNSIGLSNREIIGRIDFVGGALSVIGLIVFLAGMQWGGYMVCRASWSMLLCLAALTHFFCSSTVPLDLCSRPCTTDHWLPHAGCLWFLGGLRRQIPHLPHTPKAGASDFGPDPSHHFHLRSQFLLGAHVLAHRVFQCLRTRPH